MTKKELRPEKALKMLEVAKQMNRDSKQFKLQQGLDTTHCDLIYEKIINRIAELKTLLADSQSVQN
ncbi:MAG: hypothetical protein WBA77_00350 [Microcoleaceae cyanobacterium]